MPVRHNKVRNARYGGARGFSLSTKWCQGASVTAVSTGVCAQAVEAVQPQALANLSLEQLAQLPGNFASKSAKPIASAAASIYVLTEREVRRSGASTLPEAMRLAPNLQVARIDARNFAITTRGHNSAFANKLLVLIDGRSVYSPLFSGVFWDAQDVVLEDLQRIEVDSGPGGTLWGAHAVNGVVNLVSKPAMQTQGELLSLGAGKQEQIVTARHGGSFGGRAHYRTYAKHHQHDDTGNAAGGSGHSGWQRSQTGARMDWDDGADMLTLQGDAYTGALQQAGTQDIKVDGANFLVRAVKAYSSQSNLSLQAYVDYSLRDQPNAFRQQLAIFDLELQHEWSAGKRHHLVCGGGYRQAVDRIDNGEVFAFFPENQNLHWQYVFLQDEIRLFDNIRFTPGGNLEYNPFTGWETLPSGHAWSHERYQLLWGVVSRVVRLPSRIDRDFYAPANPEAIDGVPQYVYAGEPDFDSEVAEVLEVGYRAEHWSKVSYSVIGYYSQYDRLRTITPVSESQQVIVNGATADTYSVELRESWQAAPQWRLHTGLVVQRMHMRLEPARQDLSTGTSLAMADPNYFWQLRSSSELSDAITLRATWRFVDQLANVEVPSFAELDDNVLWQANSRLRLSLAGGNLLDHPHAEYGSVPQRRVYEHSIFGRMVWGL